MQAKVTNIRQAIENCDNKRIHDFIKNESEFDKIIKDEGLNLLLLSLTNKDNKDEVFETIDILTEMVGVDILQDCFHSSFKINNLIKLKLINSQEYEIPEASWNYFEENFI